MISDFVEFVQDLYGTKEFIPLHAPVFSGNEKQYVCDAIDSTFVSSVSDYVNQFEQSLCDYTDAKYAVSVVNGTSALHLSLHVLDVDSECEVLTQPLTFVATCNAIAYTGAQPVFIDVDRETLGLSPDALSDFLQQYAEIRDDGHTYNKQSGKRIAACIPMHTFGHPVRVAELVAVCKKWSIPVVEDAAEALGSWVVQNGTQLHCGTFGEMGVLSFNGNKVITTGAGGAIVTNNEQLAIKLKHLSTTAKVPHAWEFVHDEIGFNYRMPGLNAALGCAQMEGLDVYLQNKQELAQAYKQWCATSGDVEFFSGTEQTRPNYWLNTLIMPDKSFRDEFLSLTNARGVMTRPVWQQMNRLTTFSNAFCDNLCVTNEISDLIVNVPSSPRLF